MTDRLIMRMTIGHLQSIYMKTITNRCLPCVIIILYIIIYKYLSIYFYFISNLQSNQIINGDFERNVLTPIIYHVSFEFKSLTFLLPYRLNFDHYYYEYYTDWLILCYFILFMQYDSSVSARLYLYYIFVYSYVCIIIFVNMRAFFILELAKYIV